MERKQIAKIVVVALFAALIAAGAFIKIPLVPVPVTLQTLFVLSASTCLPVPMALLSVVAYLVLGAIGLPIFTTGGGIAALIGPTGGFLVGMVPAVLAGSLSMRIVPSKIRMASIISAAVTTAVLYLVGIPWLAAALDIPLSAAIASGLLPFIVGDTLKIAITAAVAPAVRPRIAELLERE